MAHSFREERYAALAISGHRLYRVWAQDRSAMDWVRRSVDQLDTRLSPLSRREALKNLG